MRLEEKDVMTEPSLTTIRVGRADVPTLVYQPDGGDAEAAVVLSAEAFGINDFTRRVASDLAALGYAVVVPDYYHGKGLADPESYTDFTEVMEFIDRLDFAQGAHDIMGAAEYARSLPGVDPGRVSVWGYCTGSTLAMLAASLDRQLAAAVLFFPSQPTFPELNARRPVNPIDMLWNAACPILLLLGDEDQLLVEMLPEFRRRFEQWEVDHEIKIYPGAGHAFSAPVPPLRNDAADRASWSDAIAFLGKRCPAR
jgi:carboxymethylenebutenolidase